MAVSRDSVRNTASDSTGGAEERLGGGLILAFAEQNVHQVTVPINSPIEVDPTTLHFQIDFVTIPAPSHLPTSVFAESFAQHRSQFSLPLTHGFMREDHTPLEKHLG